MIIVNCFFFQENLSHGSSPYQEHQEQGAQNNPQGDVSKQNSLQNQPSNRQFGSLDQTAQEGFAKGGQPNYSKESLCNEHYIEASLKS